MGLPLGVQRPAAFAQALGHRPDLLGLDEPTSGVALLARVRLWETIHAAAAAGADVLLASRARGPARLIDPATRHTVSRRLGSVHTEGLTAVDL